MSASTSRKPNAAATPVTDKWMSVREAARRLGCAPQTILSRALKGEFETAFVAGRTVVSRESIERAAATA